MEKATIILCILNIIGIWASYEKDSTILKMVATIGWLGFLLSITN